MEKEIKKVVEEIELCLGNIKKEYFEVLEKVLKKSKKVFISGVGRSGLIGKMFAMRLRQIGYESYVVGETITPSSSKNDLVIFISYSGEKNYNVEIAKKIKKEGTKILVISSQKKSPLSDISDFKIYIPDIPSKQFKNSLFEQCAFIFLESFILYLKEKYKISEEIFKKGHTNLE